MSTAAQPLDLRTVELKAYVPAKDFERSKSFYRELGFTLAWDSAELACLHAGATSFLLQNFYAKELAENFMMHLLVENADSWWQQVEAAQLAARYGVHTAPPEDRSWGMRDFTLEDPSGVLWRIGHPLQAPASA